MGLNEWGKSIRAFFVSRNGLFQAIPTWMRIDLRENSRFAPLLVSSTGLGETFLVN
jgi:hypothetical protein